MCIAVLTTDRRVWIWPFIINDHKVYEKTNRQTMLCKLYQKTALDGFSECEEKVTAQLSLNTREKVLHEHIGPEPFQCFIYSYYSGVYCSQTVSASNSQCLFVAQRFRDLINSNAMVSRNHIITPHFHKQDVTIQFFYRVWTYTSEALLAMFTDEAPDI